MAGWEALDRELGEANDYVLSVLPPPITAGPVQADWFFQPCTRLGGDAFGYQMLDFRAVSPHSCWTSPARRGIRAVLGDCRECAAPAMLPGVDFRDPAR